MAGGSRTLKLSILADVDNLRKGLNDAENNVGGFGGKLDGFAKKAGLAFAAAGAAAALYAGKLAIDGVKAAIEDEAAQTKLATSLKNVTGATAEQIAQVEAQILKTELLTGLTDQELRPSLDRLVRSTKNVEEAQKLQSLAIDIAAGTGKSLEAVTNALAKAHDGNTAALGKLGTGIDKATLKSMTFEDVTKSLAGTFEGQATKQADTFAGKMARLNVAFGEAKETVGSYILDAVTPLVDGIVKNVIPAVQAFVGSIGGADGLKAAFDEYIEAAKKIFIPVFEAIKFAFDKIKDAVMKNKDEFKLLFDFLKNFVAPLFGGVLKIAIEGIGTALSVVINVVGTFIRYINNAYNAVRDLIDLIANNPIVQGLGNIVGGIFGGGKATGGMVSGGTTYLVGENGPELFTPGGTGFITPNGGGTGSGTTININVSGAIDPISTARQISDILANAATSTGSFGSLGLSRIVTA
jgi:hypothetical protein